MYKIRITKDTKNPYCGMVIVVAAEIELGFPVIIPKLRNICARENVGISHALRDVKATI
jgi:hypothetical protein